MADVDPAGCEVIGLANLADGSPVAFRDARQGVAGFNCIDDASSARGRTIGSGGIIERGRFGGLRWCR